MSSSLATRPPSEVTTEEKFVNKLQKAFDAFAPTLAKALPQGRDINREISSVIATVANNSYLQKCGVSSILFSAYRAATMGLPVDDNQLAHLIPRWNKETRSYDCTYQIGYRGWIQLAVDAGFVKKIDAEEVHETDFFEFDAGRNQVAHKYNPFAERGKFLGVYATATLVNGLTQSRVMSAKEIEDIKNKYSDANNQAWIKRPGEMAKKTVIKQLLKRIPKYNTGLSVANNRSAEKFIQAINSDEDRNDYDPEVSAIAAAVAEDCSKDVVIEAEVMPVEEPSAPQVSHFSPREELISRIRDLRSSLIESGKKVKPVGNLEELETYTLEEIYQALKSQAGITAR